ncbi:MAG TPA: hypothetical protein VKK79_04455 [Candidatus Lokiarchaeia archaeon]|nr:hypothetical protein [Candidatus Lokiarchaeia archaeon]
METWELEGQLGLSTFCGGQSNWLKIGDICYMEEIDSEKSLYIKMNNQGILTFFVGKELPDISAIYS